MDIVDRIEEDIDTYTVDGAIAAHTVKAIVKQNVHRFLNLELRDFAKAAMQGIIAAKNSPAGQWDVFAKHAVEAAKALQAELNKEHES